MANEHEDEISVAIEVSVPEGAAPVEVDERVDEAVDLKLDGLIDGLIDDLLDGIGE